MPAAWTSASLRARRPFPRFTTWRKPSKRRSRRPSSFSLPQSKKKPMPIPAYNADLRAPGLALLALEFRAPLEFGSIVPAWPLLQRAPAGDGHSVLVFPGLAASDPSTLPLRGYLSTLRYKTEGWSQGLNFGPRDGVLEAARRNLEDAYSKSGRKVSLIGWSLGGVYARELAKQLPQ